MRTVNDYTPEEDPGPTSAEPDEQTIAELMRLHDEACVIRPTDPYWRDSAGGARAEKARAALESALRAALTAKAQP